MKLPTFLSLFLLAILLASGTSPSLAQSNPIPINYGESRNGVINGNEADLWTFYGSADDIITISMTQQADPDVSAATDPALDLTDPNGSRAAVDDNSGGYPNALISQLILQTTGTYTIFAYSQNQAGLGGYRLSLQLVGHYTPPPVIVVPPVEVLPVQPFAQDTTCRALVTTDGLNLRTGPGTGYARVKGLSSGDQWPITGRNADSTWMQVNVAGTTGWIRSTYMQYLGDCSNIPIVTSPDPPPQIDPQQQQNAQPPVEVVRYADVAVTARLTSVDSKARVVSLSVQISNYGDLSAPDIQVSAQCDCLGWGSDEQRLALNPGNNQYLDMRLSFPASAWNTNQMLIVNASINGGLVESNYDNNTARFQIFVPLPPTDTPARSTSTPRPPVGSISPPAATGSEDDVGFSIHIDLPEIALGAAAILGGVTVTVRRTLKSRRRTNWQSQANEEEPQSECQDSAYYCTKKKIDVKLALYKITSVEFSAVRSDSHQVAATRDIKGKAIEDLNSALTSYRWDRRVEAMQDCTKAAADELLGEIRHWLEGRSDAFDIMLQAKIEGSNVKFKFTLKHCVQHGGLPAWEIEDEWEATLTDKYTDRITQLRDMNSAAIAPTVLPELAQSLTELIKRIY